MSTEGLTDRASPFPQLVSVADQPRMKLTEDPEKQTLPGSKSAFRLMDASGEAGLKPEALPYPCSLLHTHTGAP